MSLFKLEKAKSIVSSIMGVEFEVLSQESINHA